MSFFLAGQTQFCLRHILWFAWKNNANKHTHNSHNKGKNRTLGLDFLFPSRFLFCCCCFLLPMARSHLCNRSFKISTSQLDYAGGEHDCRTKRARDCDDNVLRWWCCLHNETRPLLLSPIGVAKDRLGEFILACATNPPNH